MNKFSPILAKMKIRKDSLGDGHYDTGRIGHVHQGTDFVAIVGETIYAPFAGTITRLGYPYADSKTLRLFVLEGDNGFRATFMYALTNLVGAKVKRGQAIGTCQNVAARYSAGMVNHLHFELRDRDTLVNPELFFAVA